MTDRVVVYTAPACDWRVRGRLLERYGGDARRSVLGPPEAFSDTRAPVNPGWWFWPRIEPEQMGPNSRTVASRLNQSCCGWPKAPTAPEFYQAVRAQEPTRRQSTLVYAWGLEADDMEVAQAWAEHAYTWRQTGARAAQGQVRRLHPHPGDQPARGDREHKRHGPVDRLTRPGWAEREVLTLTEPARTLWRTIRGELARLQKQYELRPESWKMGGGTILAARWRHRQSTDIDLTTSASWQIADLGQSASNVFTEAMGKLGGELTGYRKGSIRMAFPVGKLHVYKVDRNRQRGREWRRSTGSRSRR